MIAEICKDDADAFSVVPLFEDYGLLFTRRHSFLEQQSIAMVIFQMMV